MKKTTYTVRNVFKTTEINMVHAVLIAILLFLDRMSFQFLKKKSNFCYYKLICNLLYLYRRDYELLKQVQQHCSDFFMELVSQCCFSSIAPEKPTEEFFKQLLEIVTDTEQSDFKDLFPFEEEYSHSCPITRSVLLQLLLQYK